MYAVRVIRIIEPVSHPKNAPESSGSTPAALTPWHEGVLFHTFKRFTENRGRKTDQLLSILAKGLLAPDHSSEIVLDLHLKVISSIPYTSLIFLHRYNPLISGPYLPRHPGVVCLFVNGGVKVRKPDEMGDNWPVM